MTDYAEATVEALMLAAGIHWPDIDEDQVGKLGSDVSDFGGAVVQFGYSVNKILKALEQENSAQALVALQQHWHKVSGQYLGEVDHVCGEVQSACNTAATLLYAYKAALKGELTVELGAGALSIAAATAAGTPLAGAAVAAGVYAAARHIATQLAEQIARDLSKQVVDKMTHDVESRFAGIVKDAFNKLGDQAYSALVTDVPQANLSAGQQNLAISSDSLYRATTNIKASVEEVTKAVGTIKNAIHHTSLKGHVTENLPHDTYLRTMLKGAIEGIVAELVDQVFRLCERLVEHATGLVGLFNDAISDADKALSKDAKKKVDQLMKPPTPTTTTRKKK